MKKIALFSCHNDPNYGSMLQAYALHAALKKLGWDSEYINYIIGNEPPKGFGRILEKLKRLPQIPSILINRLFRNRSEFYFFHTPDFASTIEAFHKFHDEYIPCSRKVYYRNSVERELDVTEYGYYMVGSDQMWSPNLYSPAKPYFLDFANLPNRCAYAPSMGTTVIPKEFAELIRNKLIAFDHLSCREAANSKFLTDLIGKPVTHVLDPTLLLTDNDWDMVANGSSLHIREKYILAYILGEKDNVIAFAEQLGKREQLPVYYILTRPKYLPMKNLLTGVGPDSFVNLVRNASCVVTDSYHGTIFSITYQKNFYAFSKREGEIDSVDNIRILEFLQMLGLENRFQDEKKASFLDDIDYTQCNSVIKSKRESSLLYLKECLQ